MWILLCWNIEIKGNHRFCSRETSLLLPKAKLILDLERWGLTSQCSKKIGMWILFLATLVEDMVELGKMSSEVVKMGKASRNKNYNINKLTPPLPPKVEDIPPPPSSSTPQTGFHPLSLKKKKKILEALDRKYKELEEEKQILKVLNNYMVYRKKLDAVMMGRDRLENKDFREEEKERIIENSFPKKFGDPGNLSYPFV
ncbi:hypothetical protein Tco_0803587 [Tanacetum coccineum]|uniref:Uncharacterized protein n=1 Tax=Tanacetum coccineum TaxID=301880 RepID=A0ABQ5A1Z5_9ASTR